MAYGYTLSHKTTSNHTTHNYNLLENILHY